MWGASLLERRQHPNTPKTCSVCRILYLLLNCRCQSLQMTAHQTIHNLLKTSKGTKIQKIQNIKSIQTHRQKQKNPRHRRDLQGSWISFESIVFFDFFGIFCQQLASVVLAAVCLLRVQHAPPPSPVVSGFGYSICGKS